MGTLGLTKTFNSLAPISMQFIELAPAANTNFGFRININETVINQSGFNWSAFKLDIVDTNQVYDEFQDPSHPDFAHIHPSFVPLSAPPFTTNIPNGLGGLGFSNVLLSAGTFLNGETNSWTGIALHQYEFKNLQRPFTFIETPIPVPEPSALFLISVSVLWFAVFRRRRS